MKSLISCVVVLLLFFAPSVLAEAGSISAITVTDNPDGTKEYSITLQVLAMMTALSFIPAIVMLMTSFTRIIVVLAILRQALGLQQTPNSQLLIGMALFLSFFIMAPVFDEIHQNAIEPYLAEEITSIQAYDIAKVPMREFMLAQTRLSDLETFAEIAGYTDVNGPEDLPLTVIIPSFVTSELKTAFQIGFMFFIPFLIIDLVVASVLMAMGMMMLSPMIVSLPFKLMMFVLVDGWSLVMGTLAKSFGLGT